MPAPPEGDRDELESSDGEDHVEPGDQAMFTAMLNHFRKWETRVTKAGVTVFRGRGGLEGYMDKMTMVSTVLLSVSKVVCRS